MLWPGVGSISVTEIGSQHARLFLDLRVIACGRAGRFSEVQSEFQRTRRIVGATHICFNFRDVALQATRLRIVPSVKTYYRSECEVL